jgi:hypothetical protein
MDLVCRINTRAEVAALCEKTEVFLIGTVLLQEDIGQIEDLLELTVPCNQMLCSVKHGYAVTHILECDAEFLLALPYFVQ